MFASYIYELIVDILIVSAALIVAGIFIAWMVLS